jgi:peptidylprolyl isomerase
MKHLLLLTCLCLLISSCGKKEAELPPVDTMSVPPPPLPPPSPKEPITRGDTTITPSGLMYIDVKEGKGESPKQGQQVTVNYTGMLVNGTVFDSNVDPKFGHVEPYTTAIGVGAVIPGWDEGLMTMKPGGKRKLMIPGDLAYGSQPPPGSPIPPDAMLIFDIELISVK